MSTLPRLCILCLPLFIAAPALAQQYKLPPSMQNAPAEDKSVHWTKGPYVKIHGLQCTLQNSNYGVATGEVENISRQTLNQVEVRVSWPGFRSNPVFLRALKPGERTSFRLEGSASGGKRDCQATVAVR